MSKYSKEQLELIIKDSLSYRQVIQKLGLKPAGGNHSYIKSLAIKFNIDDSHFRGKGSNFGEFHKGTKKLSAETILIYDRLGGRREQATLLRRALVQSGVEEKCECGLGPVWNGKPITLQVDHKNGDSLDNRRENLRFLCPNCHSQTENFGSKNVK